MRNKRRKIANFDEKYITFTGRLNWKKLEADRMWLTDDLELVKYSDLSLEHLKNIVKLFIAGRFYKTTREIFHKSILEEYYSRLSPAGKILYGNN